MQIQPMQKTRGWFASNRLQYTFNWNLGAGIAVREYQTDVGPADYVLFVDREPIGVIEAKKEYGQSVLC